ncbi:MAG TPA: Mut7-C RNAse domain-containing protein [Candidatus Limnocylindrales bacterium]
MLDGHLGRLARGLRMLGFDSWYRTDADDDELAAVAGRDDRIVLTRDRGLLRRASVRRGAFVRSDRPQEQLAEVVERFDLASRSTPFGRCIRCNGLLDPVDKADILDRLEPLTRAHYVEFRRCRACAAIYWPGSHHARMQAVVESVLRPRTSR